MKALQLQLPDTDEPLFIRIAAAIVAAIQDGRLEAASRLPSTRVLASSFEVHRQTVMSACAELVAQGWLTAHPRSGYRVNSALPTNTGLLQRLKLSATRPVRLSPVFGDSNVEIDADPRDFDYPFRAECPALDAFPNAEFRRHIGQVLRQNWQGALDYGPPEGNSELIAELQGYAKRVRSISGKRLILTSGAQESIYLTSRLLLDSSTCVAVEPLGYPPAWRAFRAAGAKLVPLRMDKYGVIPASFARATEEHEIRMIYLTPLHQFPTTATLPLDRRMEIYEIARQHRVAILEDDYDHEFHYNHSPLAPLASNDPAQIVFYVFSLSKLAFPSLRVGALMAPAYLADNLLAYRQIAVGNPGQILPRATALWMRGGGFERHMWRMRRIYQERRDRVLEALTIMQNSGLDLSFSAPDGGMAIWLDVHRDTDTLARQAREKGILLQTQSSYQLQPGVPATHIRLGFANQDEDHLLDGLCILGKLLCA